VNEIRKDVGKEIRCMKKIENMVRRDKKEEKGGWNRKIKEKQKTGKCPFRAYPN
jgi:hypothetical protein